jgi:GR25 family glycosyltransferase involved in LPS biosynthesis
MLSEVFEKVYVITLPRRPDRWEKFEKRLPYDWPFNKPKKFEAVDGGIVTHPIWWNGGPGGWGCYKSHIRIIEDCLNNGIESVLILEDDAVCVDNFKNKVEVFWNYLPNDWAMVYLGGQHIQEHLGLPVKINDWVYKPFNVNRCHAYGFRGRRMLEQVYLHLHNYFTWKVPHHIDHQLGELHKILEKGCYAPHEWLIAQSDGQSDICGQKLEYRRFTSAEEIVYPKLDIPGIAVLGGYFGGTNTIAGVLQHLGIFMGYNCPPLDKSTAEIKSGEEEKELDKHFFFEDALLVNICLNHFTEPWLYEKTTHIDRVNHLRFWAGIQCKHKPQGAKHFCGKHPMFSLMGHELIEAWNDPYFICVERPVDDCIKAMSNMKWAWHFGATTYALNKLKQVREEFIKKYAPKMLWLAYDHAMLLPEKTVKTICDFINYSPTVEQWHKAINFMKISQNDYCYI